MHLIKGVWYVTAQATNTCEGCAFDSGVICDIANTEWETLSCADRIFKQVGIEELIKELNDAQDNRSKDR